MARKDDVDFGEEDLDDLNFDDLDFGDAGGDPFGEARDDRKPIQHAKDSFKSGVKNKLTDPSLFKRLIKNALPKGYGQLLDAYDAVDSSISDVLQDKQSDLNPYMLAMQRKLKNNPNLRRMLPKSIVNAAENASKPYSFKEEDELGNNLGALDEMFKLQATQNVEQRFNTAVKDVRDQKRFSASMKVDLLTAKGIGRLVSYQDNILVNYHRKSLEISYRQLDVGLRTLKGQVEFFSSARASLGAIVKNTALPDFIKMQTKEVVEQQIKQKLVQSLTMSAGAYAGRLFSGIKKNASDLVGNAIDFHGQLGEGENFGKTRAQMAGSIAGTLASDWVGDKASRLGEKAGNLAKPYIDRIPGMRRSDNFLRRLLTDPASLLNEYAKSDTDYDSKTGLLQAGIKSLFDTHSASTSIAGQRIDTLDAGGEAKFDNLYYKTVTEILPAQLASIDRWVKTMATGEDQEETAWSHYTGSLVKRSTLNKQNLKIAIKDNGNSVRSSIDNLLAEMEANELTDQAKRALRKKMLTQMANNMPFKPEFYVDEDNWKDTDPSVANEIIEFIAGKFQVNRNTKESYADEERKRFTMNINDVYTSTKNSIPEYGKKMDALAQVLGRRGFRELGLSAYNGANGDNIQLSALYDALLEGDEKELKKKVKINETPAQKAKRMVEEERQRQLKARGIFDVEDDSKLKGKFGQRGPGPHPLPPYPFPPSPFPGPSPSPTPPPAPPPIPNTIKAEVNWPDILKVADSGSHERLDALKVQMEVLNAAVEFIAKNGLPNNGPGGGPGDAGGPPGGPGDPAPGPGGNRGGMFTRFMKGALGGAWWAARKTGSYVFNTWKLMGQGAIGGVKLLGRAATLPFQRISGFGISDIYVFGETTPRMTAREIRDGHYKDVGSDKIIEKIADITGRVVDREGNEVLSDEDFKKGLYNGKGQSLAGMLGRGAVSAGKLMTKGIAGYFKFTYGTMWKVGKKLVETAVDQFTQFDAYFPGDEEPRIRSTLMKKGYYRSADGEPIWSLKDITGPVFDINGNEVVSQEEIDRYKSFYSRNGSLLFTIGRGFASLSGGALKIAGRAAMAYGRFVGKVYKGAWKLGKGIIGGIWKNTFGRLGKSKGGAVGMLDDEMQEAAIEIGAEQLRVQTEILKLLKTNFGNKGSINDTDGDGVRDYSWQDILRRRKERSGVAGMATVPSSDPIVEAINKLNENLSDKLDELAEVTEEAGESSLLEDAANLSEATGRDGGRRRRGGRGRGGRMRRMGGKLVDGVKKVGKWIGKIPGAGLLGRGALAAGSLALSGAGAVLSGAATAATAVIGAVGLPVILGVAAVAGIGYLGYRYYQSEKVWEYPILCLRMTQYGVNPKDKARVEKMVQLEGLCKGALKIDNAGTGTLNPEMIDAHAFSQLFKCENQEEMKNLMTWLTRRFRPVYIAHAAAMQRIRGTTELSSSDDGLSEVDLDVFLSLADIPNMDKVYDDTDTSPFDKSLDCDADDVRDAVKRVRAKHQRKKDKNNAFENAGVVAAGTTAATVAAATTLGVSKEGNTSANDIAKGIKVLPATLGAVGASYSALAAPRKDKKNQALDIPTAVRYRTYGLKELRLDRCQQLEAAENVYWDRIEYSGTEKSMISGNTDDLQTKIMDIFKPADEHARNELIRWLEKRFIPVLLQFAISARRRYNGPAKEAFRHVTGPLMKEILNEVTATKVPTIFMEVSVWTIVNSPWPGLEMETMPGSVKVYIDSIDDGTTSRVLDVAGMETQKRTDGANAQFGNRMTNVALGNTTAAGTQANVGKTGSTFQNYGKIYGSGAVAGGTTGQSTTGQGTGAMLMTGNVGGGQEVKHPGGGTGGDVNSLPNNTGKGLAQMGPIITGAAKMVGFDPEIALTVAGVESGLDPRASSGIANGLFQFIGSTWNQMMSKYGAQYGIAPGTPPTDPRANAILGVCYLKENYEGLSPVLGKNVTDLDLYFTHFLGLGGAKKFLSAPGNEPSYKYVGNGSAVVQVKPRDGGNAVTGSNKSIFFKSDYKQMYPKDFRTVAEVKAEMGRRLRIGAKNAGISVSSTAGDKEVPTPTQGASGNPTESGGAAAAGGFGTMANNTPDSPAAQETAGGGGSTPTPTQAPAQAANLGAGGMTPVSSASSTPTPSVAAAPNAPSNTATDVGDGGTIPPQAPAVSPSNAAAAASQSRGQLERQGETGNLPNIWVEHLEVTKDSRNILIEIAKKLDAIVSRGGASQLSPAGPSKPDSLRTGTPEPTSRNPLSVSRPNAVT